MTSTVSLLREQSNVDEQFKEEKPVHLGLHLALLAAERFHLTTGRWPGSTEADDLVEENRRVEETAVALVKAANPALDIGSETADCIAEV